MPTPPARTVLAFDFGLRQIGVAVGNTLLGTTRPLAILKAREGVPDWLAIEALIREWQPDPSECEALSQAVEDSIQYD